MILAAGFTENLFRGLLQGTPSGAVFALIAMGFVLTYKTSGVFNLAFGAQAYISAAMYFKARNDWEWAIVPALILSVFILAPAIGLILERFLFRHLRTASAVSKLVVTIGLSIALPAIFEIFADAPAFGRPPEGIVPRGSEVLYDPFGVYRFNRDELMAMAVVLIAVGFLGVLFRFTSLGLSMRAVVESPRMTALNGIDADRVSAFAWALSSTFAGMAGVLIAPIRFNTLIPNDFFSLIVVAIAAAAIGRLVSIPWAVVGGLALGWFQALFKTFLPGWAQDYPWLQPLNDHLSNALPFIVLFGILVLWPAIRRSADVGDPLAGVDPPPPALAASERHPSLTLFTRLFGVAFIGTVLFVVLTRGDVSWIRLVSTAVVLSTIYLSITVITGFAGQISLCQGAFAAIGAFTVFQMADRYDMSVLLAALIGAVIAAIVGALFSLPVLRLGGVWLAIATLAFAFFFDQVMVKLSWIGGGRTALEQGTQVPRPQIGLIDFGNDKAFLVLAVVVFTVVSIAVIQLREGTIGRTLRALRGSEVAAESIGISPARARIVAFATSAFIAGLGGAMLAMLQENVNYSFNFSPVGALFWLVLVVSLSVRTVEGAAQAGAAFSLFDPLILKGQLFGWILRSDSRLPGIFPISPKWRFILFGLSAVQFARHPEGLIEYGKRSFTARLNARLRARDELDTSDTTPEPTPDGAQV